MSSKHFLILASLFFFAATSPLAVGNNFQADDDQNASDLDDIFSDDTEPEPPEPVIDFDRLDDENLGLDDSNDEQDNNGKSLSFCPDAGEMFSNVPPISQVSASIRLTSSEVPEDCSSYVFEGTMTASPRSSQLVPVHWEPTNFFHHPLYFDDTPLERYGQSIHPKAQPFISASRFFLTFPILPYKMGIDRPYDCVSTLGYYRPGSCAPCTRERFPAWERDATLLEVGTALAFVFALP